MGPTRLISSVWMSSRLGSLPFFSTLKPMSSFAAVPALVNPGSSGYSCRSRRTFDCLFGALPFSRRWCATWFAVVLQCCFGMHVSSQSLRIVDHAFLLLWVMSVDSIRVCHALRRSSEMALISSSPIVMVLSAKGSYSYFSRYSSISWMDSGVRPGTQFLLHPRGMFFRAGFRKGVHELVITFGCCGDVLRGCIELICVLLPVCLIQVESSPERYGLHGDSCNHLHSNGSMFVASYWFHHNLVAAPGNSVGSKDDVRVIFSPPSTAVERAGKLRVVNQAQSFILCPVLYQFAVSVSHSIAPGRTVAVEVPNDHLLLVSYLSHWLVERETFTWWFVN